jgi:hypothetical protein
MLSESMYSPEAKHSSAYNQVMGTLKIFYRFWEAHDMINVTPLFVRGFRAARGWGAPFRAGKHAFTPHHSACEAAPAPIASPPIAPCLLACSDFTRNAASLTFTFLMKQGRQSWTRCRCGYPPQKLVEGTDPVLSSMPAPPICMPWGPRDDPGSRRNCGSSSQDFGVCLLRITLLGSCW